MYNNCNKSLLEGLYQVAEFNFYKFYYFASSMCE